jgi:tetratricopeptide (TPR) repeat protein
MTELRIEDYEIPAADLGPENPLPVFRGPDDDTKVNLDPNLPEEDRRYMGWRTAFRVLPYRMQDGYTRDRRPRAFRAAILENEFLRATFLPELGGKLVSLVHKEDGRELLDRNPVFQPANLALRSAWSSGGIEWNAGQLGHHYLTCSPIFAARVAGSRGQPVLRLYEWNRVTCFPYQVDFHLPPGSRFLFSRTRIVNPHDHEIHMYWWTNMAVPERPDARTLCPAETVITHTERGLFGLLDLPEIRGIDATYAARHPFAGEFFLRIPDGQRRWIAVLDGEGKGLVQTSTDRLKGRKMFVWGSSPGGRRWQEYLAAPGCAYLEVQAGLARTQLESLPMPARAEWAWTEAFGLLKADPAQVHSADWNKAWRAADAALESVLPRAQVETLDREFSVVTARPPDEILVRGSGWGALERTRVIGSLGDWVIGKSITQSPNHPTTQRPNDPIPPELVFDEESMGPEQEPWLALLETGALPERDPQDDPGAYMTQPEWRGRLEAAVAAGQGDHWLSWYHLGVMRMEARDLAGARKAWERSISLRRSGWALRNLAALESREGNREAACDLLRRAWEAGPQIAPLAQEYARALLDLQRFDDLREFINGLPETVRWHERIHLLAATAALRTGHPEELEGLFDQDFATIREGEITLTDLWFEWHARRLVAAENLPLDDALRARARREFPPPARIDFRMAADR